MITQTLQLNLVPKGVWPRLYVSQYDAGSRTLTFEIYNGDQRFTLTSGTTAKIQGTKPDRHGFSYDANVDTSNNVVTADITQQMTAAHGEAYCELVLFKSGQRIGTLNFVMMIQQAGLNDETDTSDSDLPDIIAEATEQMLTAEAYAKGTRNGTAVTSGQTGYHDNSKYYKEQAATQASNASTSATSANTNALKAEGYAVGKQNGTTQTSGTYYHNNAQYYKEQAASSATTASTKAGEASSSANTASQKASAASTSAQTASDKALVAEGYAKGTQNGTPVGSTSPYYHNNAEYFKDLANPTVAANVSFNNSGTEMSSTNVQDGIVENRTSIQNLSNQVKYNTKNGVKNIIPYPYYGNGTLGYGVNYIDNADGTVTIRGTNSSSTANLIMFYWFVKNDFLQNYVGETLSVSFEGLTTAESTAYAPLIFYDSNGTEISRITFSSSNTHAEFTVTSAMKTATLRFHVRESKTVDVTLKAMICRKDLYDKDTTWEPPAFSNPVLTQETTGLIDNTKANGCVNLLETNITSRTTAEGVVITANSDGSYTVSSSSAPTVSKTIESSPITLEPGTYYWCCAKDGESPMGEANCFCFLIGINGTNDWKRSYIISESSQSNYGEFTVTQTSSIKFCIRHGTATISSRTFYPMIRRIGLKTSYVPYAKTNKELTDDVADIPYVALSDNGSSEYTLAEGAMWQTKGVTFLYVAVQCNTVSPSSGGNHIKISEIPSKFKKPPLILYPAIAPYRDATTGAGAQLQIATNGQIAIRGGEVGGRYSGLFSY